MDAAQIKVKNFHLLLATTVCSHPSKGIRREMMRSVTVRLNAAQFSAAMTTIGEWIAVLVTVDFLTEMAAEAFAARFDGVYHSSIRPESPDNSQSSPV